MFPSLPEILNNPKIPNHDKAAAELLSDCFENVKKSGVLQANWAAKQAEWSSHKQHGDLDKILASFDIYFDDTDGDLSIECDGICVRDVDTALLNQPEQTITKMVLDEMNEGFIVSAPITLDMPTKSKLATVGLNGRQWRRMESLIETAAIIVMVMPHTTLEIFRRPFSKVAKSWWLRINMFDEPYCAVIESARPIVLNMDGDTYHDVTIHERAREIRLRHDRQYALNEVAEILVHHPIMQTAHMAIGLVGH